MYSTFCYKHKFVPVMRISVSYSSHIGTKEEK